MNSIPSRLTALRASMQAHDLDALVIPANDPHQSEYVADHWKSREWFSGFTGSAGHLTVFKDYAALWTDTRYFLQAETELKDSGITLHKMGLPDSPKFKDWLADFLPEGSTVGLEGLLFSVSQAEDLEDRLEKRDISLKNVDGIIGQVWTDRPPMPDTLAYAHEVHFAGRSREYKLEQIREKMTEAGTQYYLVSALDEIAWTLNIRAWDIECTPVALSYLLIGEKEAFWMINPAKVPADLQKTLETAGVEIRPYERVTSLLGTLPVDVSLYVDKAQLSWSLRSLINCEVHYEGSIIQPIQALKNETEVQHIRAAMIRDGVALVHFFRWLEKALPEQKLKETDLADQLSHFRSQQAHYVGDSFPPIVGYRSNGAIVHYHAQEATAATLAPEGILLVDSGGQYLDGTTDITRTISLGTPTEEEKLHFTLVLKGYLTLQTIRFPSGTCGVQLDTLARMHLWKEGLNYGHGTGHGVGFFLRVHEPPQSISATAVKGRSLLPFKAGMLTSNEPGFYKTGAYGIRTENLMLCIPFEENEYGNFLQFESVTLFPIDQTLIEVSLLDAAEIEWLNRYHEQVYEALAPHLNAEEQAWLKEKCQPVR